MLILTFLAFYLPIEEFVLKWIPVSEQVYLILRQIPDFLIFGLGFVLVALQKIKRKKLPSSDRWADLFFIVFFVWAILTIFFNESDVFRAFANIKAFVRYVFLIYIILMIAPTQRQMETTIRWIGYSILLQVIFGVFQYIGGIPARDLLSARQISESIGGFTTGFTGTRFEEGNNLMGTLGSTINYATFLIIGLGMWGISAGLSLKKYWLGVFCIVILIFLSGSRSAVVAAMLLVLMQHFYAFGKISVLRWLGLMAPFFILILLILIVPYVLTLDDEDSLLYIFNEGYLEHAYNQRLGIVTILLPELAVTVNTLFGFSSDIDVLVNFVSVNIPAVHKTLLIELPNLLEDVYWVAILAYYGLIGLLLWCSFMFRLVVKISYCRRYSIRPFTKHLCTIALLFLFISIPLNFLNQAFEVRQFSFYLWLFCGLALASYRNERRDATRSGAL